jgi:hypothetical protein
LPKSVQHPEALFSKNRTTVATTPFSLGPSLPQNITTAILDTGATGHFLSILAPYSNKRIASPALHVSLADHSVMVSSHQVDLNLPLLPISACTAHLFPALSDNSLIFIGQLCDAGCTATFTASTVQVHLHTDLLFEGNRSAATNFLWRVTLSIPPPPIPSAFIAIQGSPAQLVAFAHAAFFSPSLSTLQQVLKKN